MYCQWHCQWCQWRGTAHPHSAHLPGHLTPFLLRAPSLLTHGMADGGLGGGGAPLQRPGAPSSRSRTGAGAAGAGAAPDRQADVLQRPLCPGQQRSRRSATAYAGAMEEEGGAGAGAAAPVRARPGKRPLSPDLPGAEQPVVQRRGQNTSAQRSGAALAPAACPLPALGSAGEGGAMQTLQPATAALPSSYLPPQSSAAASGLCPADIAFLSSSAAALLAASPRIPEEEVLSPSERASLRARIMHTQNSGRAAVRQGQADHTAQCNRITGEDGLGGLAGVKTVYGPVYDAYPADPGVPTSVVDSIDITEDDLPTIARHVDLLHFATSFHMELSAQGDKIGVTFTNLAAMNEFVWRFLARCLGLKRILVEVRDCAKTYGHPYESVEMGPLSHAYKWMALLVMTFTALFPWAYAARPLLPRGAAASASGAPTAMRPARSAGGAAAPPSTLLPPSTTPTGTGSSSVTRTLYSRALVPVIPRVVFTGATRHSASNDYVSVYKLADGSKLALATHPSVPRPTAEIASTAIALARMLGAPLPPALLVFTSPAVLAAMSGIVTAVPSTLLVALRNPKGRAEVGAHLATSTALPPELCAVLIASLLNASSLSYANKRALSTAAVDAGFEAQGGLSPGQVLLKEAMSGSGGSKGGMARARAVGVGDCRGKPAARQPLGSHLEAIRSAGDLAPHPRARALLQAAAAAAAAAPTVADIKLLERELLERLEAQERGRIAGALSSAAAAALHALPADGRARALAAARPAWKEGKLARAAPHAAGGGGGGSSAAQRGGGSRRGGSSSSSIVGGALPQLQDAMRVLQKIDAGECDLVCLVCVCCARLPFSPYPALPTPRGAPHTPLRTCL